MRKRFVIVSTLLVLVAFLAPVALADGPVVGEVYAAITTVPLADGGMIVEGTEVTVAQLGASSARVTWAGGSGWVYYTYFGYILQFVRVVPLIPTLPPSGCVGNLCCCWRSFNGVWFWTCDSNACRSRNA